MNIQFPDYSGFVIQAINFIRSEQYQINYQRYVMSAGDTQPGGRRNSAYADALLEYRTVGVMGPRQSGKTQVIGALLKEYPNEALVVVHPTEVPSGTYAVNIPCSQEKPLVEFAAIDLIRQLIHEVVTKGKCSNELPPELDVLKNKAFIVLDDGVSVLTYSGIEQRLLCMAIAELYRGHDLPIIVILG